MRNIKKIQIILAIFFVPIFFTNCKKTDSPTSNGDIIPSSFSNLVPQSLIDSLRKVGAVVNTGTNPPIINGIYSFSPDSCIFDNSPSNSKGQLFADYRFQFSNQNNSNYTLNIAQKLLPAGTLSANPVYTFISGSGNSFSVFSIRTASPTGIPANFYNIFSGTLTAKGISNFSNTLYIRSKNDPTNTLAPAGTIRIFVVGGAGIGTSQSIF